MRNAFHQLLIFRIYHYSCNGITKRDFLEENDILKNSIVSLNGHQFIKENYLHIIFIKRIKSIKSAIDNLKAYEPKCKLSLKEKLKRRKEKVYKSRKLSIQKEEVSERLKNETEELLKFKRPISIEEKSLSQLEEIGSGSELELKPLTLTKRNSISLSKLHIDSKEIDDLSEATELKKFSRRFSNIAAPSKDEKVYLVKRNYSTVIQDEGDSFNCLSSSLIYGPTSWAEYKSVEIEYLQWKGRLASPSPDLAKQKVPNLILATPQDARESKYLNSSEEVK